VPVAERFNSPHSIKIGRKDPIEKYVAVNSVSHRLDTTNPEKR
jgi:hypothetical protein